MDEERRAGRMREHDGHEALLLGLRSYGCHLSPRMNAPGLTRYSSLPSPRIKALACLHSRLSPQQPIPQAVPAFLHQLEPVKPLVLNHLFYPFFILALVSLLLSN